jgi:formylglycine-generating enzyme required for sulfatase activity
MVKMRYPMGSMKTTIILFALLMSICLTAPSAMAFKKYATAEGVSCGYCHKKESGGGPRNYRGVFYKAQKLSFAGFDDEAEAKKAGQAVAPFAAEKPNSQASVAVSAGPSNSLLGPITQYNDSSWRTSPRQKPYNPTYVIKGDEVEFLLANQSDNDNGGQQSLLHNLPTELKDGETVTLSFEAKAKDPLTISLMARQSNREKNKNEPIIAAKERKTFTLTPEFQTFSATFTLRNVDDTSNQIGFGLGRASGAFSIKNVILARAVNTTPVGKPAPGDSDPANLKDLAVGQFGAIAFVKIPVGQYVRGLTDVDKQAMQAKRTWSRTYSVEMPAKQVRITKSIAFSQFEITQAQWEEVMGTTPSAFKGNSDRPVEQITYNDALKFCAEMSKRYGGTFRLPTEAEWEYVARAGEKQLPMVVTEMGWVFNNSGNKTQPVGKKKPNAWGIYDMLGNVWEWCADSYQGDYYTKSPENDPLCLTPTATERVLRGGCYALDPNILRFSLRGGQLPTFKSQYIGLRIVREL